jgi:hypothetical protein
MHNILEIQERGNDEVEVEELHIAFATVGTKLHRRTSPKSSGYNTKIGRLCASSRGPLLSEFVPTVAKAMTCLNPNSCYSYFLTITKNPPMSICGKNLVEKSIYLPHVSARVLLSDCIRNARPCVKNPNRSM